MLTTTFLMIATKAVAGEISYPSTKHVDQTDNYHGTVVADPFRWLEDDTSPQTKVWVDAQNKVTFGYLEKLAERKAIKERLTKLWNFERYGVPFKEGGRYFFTKNDGLQNQSVLYTADSLKETPRLLLDPNKLSTDGTAATKPAFLPVHLPSRSDRRASLPVRTGG